MAMPCNLRLQSSACFATYNPPNNVSKRTASVDYCVMHNARCLASTTRTCESVAVRRSASYQPSIWDFDTIQSLKSEYMGKMCESEAKKLKENVRSTIFNSEEVRVLHGLEKIDKLIRLGVSYHFEEEIKNLLGDIAMSKSSLGPDQEDLHAVSLYFRLLRQYGYEISQDVFNCFKDDSGQFKSSLHEDIKGMLSFNDASHLAFEGEDILDEAKYLTTTYLKEIKTPLGTSLSLPKLVSHSLELPLHWRMQRLEARWYIEVCMKEGDIDHDLLKFAILDFNMVQETHQNDLKDMSRWWKDLGLGSHPKLSFARDRLMECFFWTTGVISDPRFDYCRKWYTKLNTLVTTIDDVYDVYGTLDELTLFTAAVERWDINTIGELPNYMKICFLALYNTVNEMGYVILKEQGWDAIPYLKQSWTDLCKSYLVEAKWYYNKYTPTFDEYLSNACISISGPLLLFHIYFFIEQDITTEALECLGSCPNVIRSSSMILRLSDDLGTSKAELERGDVPKSIQCYMHETGVSEEVARDYIKHMIGNLWKKMNKDRLDDSLFSQTYIGAVVNLARMAQCIYQYGDGHGIPDRETKDQVLSLLVEPIMEI